MSLRSHMHRFKAADEGALLPWFAISLAVFLGLTALSFDLGRLASTQSELQSFADHVALAAAGELDGEAGAINRARAAAAELVGTRSGGWPPFLQTFGLGAQELAIADYALTFHPTLPGLDTQPMTAVTDLDGSARYVRATIVPRTVPYSFSRAFNALADRAGPNEATVSASAVAGFTSYVCDITPMMFCVPPANPQSGIGTFDADARVGHMIHLRAGGGSGQWGAGNWGWLRLGNDVAAAPTSACAGITSVVQRTLCLLGTSGPRTGCYENRGTVDLGPGQNVGTFEAAVNVRFDRFSSTMNQQRNDPDFGPAPNIVQGAETRRGQGGGQGGGGQGGGQCSVNAVTDSVPLPKDTCFLNGTCDRFGDGVFDLAGYVATNYGTQVPNWYTSSQPMTRYEVYLAEIAAAASNPGGRILPNRTETGIAQCSQHPTSDADRRVIIAAGIDCLANNIQGAATGIPVMQYVRLFITEPVPGGPDRNMYVEIIGSAGGRGEAQTEAGIIREVVQLYR